MSGSRGLRSGHWLLIGLVVVIVAAGVWVVVNRGDGGPTTAEPTTAPSSSASVAPRADCEPEIVEAGMAGDGPRYGFVYRNRCDQVVRLLIFRVTPQDGSGNPINDLDQDTVNGGVLLPGTELGAMGTLQVPKGRRVAKIGVEVVRYQDFPAADFSAWAKADVTDLKKTASNSLGEFTLTGTLRKDPPSAPVCVTAYVLILRNAQGRILWTDEQISAPSDPAELSFEAPGRPGADLARSTIYAVQLPAAAVPVPGSACNGAG